MSENKAAGRYQSYTQAVADAKAGVQEAFTYLYESTYRDKYYIAQKYMRNETDAQDVLQDAYMKAWQNLGQLQEAEKFPHWLSMIVASTALNALKKKKDLPFSALEKGTEDGDTFAFEEEDWRREYQPEQTYTDKETAELLKELMDGLSDEQRFCVLMYYVEEHSVGEIAKTIGCSENTVKSRLNYGRKNLRAKAEEMEKKGYKLYGIAALPLLLWLLRKEAMAASFALPALNTAAAAAVSKSGAAGGGAGAAGTASAAPTGTATAGSTAGGAGTASAAPTGTATAGSTAGGAGSAAIGGAGGMTSVAATTTAVAAKAAGVSLGVKVAAAVLAVAVLGGGGVAASRLLSSPSEEQIVDTTGTDSVTAEQVADTDVTNDEDAIPTVNTDTIRYVILLNPDATIKEIVYVCEVEIDQRKYTFYSDNPGDDVIEKQSYASYPPNVLDRTNVHYFLGETSELIITMFDESYHEYLEPHQDLLLEAYHDISKQKAESERHQSQMIDLTESLPKRITMSADGKMLEFDMIKAEADGFVEHSDTEDGITVPHWRGGDGTYLYVTRLYVNITISSEQMMTLFEFLNGLVETEINMSYKEKKEKRIEYEKRLEAEKNRDNTEQSKPAIDLVGTWYDPTRYNVGIFTFHEDGTGVLDWNGNGSSTASFTYSVSGNTITCQLARTSCTLTINGDSLKYGGSKYVKK